MRIPADLAETLAAIIDEGSFDGAAYRLGITQPAVSQRLRALERIVGQVLLVRSRPLQPTAAGLAVARLARQILHLEADTVAELGIAEDGTRTTLPIAVNNDSLSTWFLTPLMQLSERLPVVFDLHRADQDFTVDLLEAGLVLAAVTSSATPIAGCRITPLGVMQYRPMATVEFCDRWFPGGVTDEALAVAPVVDYDRNDELQTRWLRQRGIDPLAPPRHRLPASAEYADAVRGGLGWGQLLPTQAERGLTEGRLIALDDTSVDVELYWQQWNVHSALLDDVASVIAAHARDVLLPLGEV